MGNFFTTSKKRKLHLVVPYRPWPNNKREDHLKEFIPHMKDYLNKRGIEHEIWIIEQIDQSPFNKCLLYNVAMKLIEEYDPHSYVCFHDVDIIPEGDCDYSCPPVNTVRQLYGYKFSLALFTIRFEDLLKINGFSNLYDHWGYEDNDILRRVQRNGLTVDYSTFTERYDQRVFRELHVEDREGPLQRMNFRTTKENERLFNSDVDSSIDGLCLLKDWRYCKRVVPIDGHNRVWVNVTDLREYNTFRPIV